VWWCGLVLFILYAGKAWCYVCPWDAVATWSERLRFRSGGRADAGIGLGLRWPRALRNIWPATILFLGLTWIELGFGVTMNSRATAWLGLSMLGLAFVSAIVFERKSFCRYGCLVGRISGLYALFSPVEIRARNLDVCRTCPTRSCFHGNAKGDACPTFQYLGSMDQNTYCISCMECVKTCEADNVALRLRPWGEDLVQRQRPRSDEAYLALLMLALTGFHGLTMTGAWGRCIDWLSSNARVSETVAFSMGMAAIIAGPLLLYALLVALSRWSARQPRGRYREHFLRYAYALLPIALFYHLAHNSEHLLMEGQRLAALLSDPFGWEWNLFGTATWVPAPLLSTETLWGVQVLLVLTGHVYSLWAARQAASSLYADARAAFRSQVPMLAAMILFSIMSLWLLKQPMEMRMSWM
jgi:ferredoxin